MARRAGLALARASEILGAEPFFHELIAGVERSLMPHGLSLLLQVVPTPLDAARTIERWHRAGLVEAIALIDLLPDDPRVDLVQRFGIPAVVIGDPQTAKGLPTVWAEDDLAMREAVSVLAGLGHSRIAHVSGPASLAHTGIRRSAFHAAAVERGLEPLEVEGDYSQRSGAEATATLLRRPEPPTAIVADNDLMALGALTAATESGCRVPTDLSILAWDDSALCQLSVPTLSAMSHDVQGIGALVGTALLDALAERPARVVTAPRASFVLRESTAAPAASSPTR